MTRREARAIIRDVYDIRTIFAGPAEAAAWGADWLRPWHVYAIDTDSYTDHATEDEARAHLAAGAQS